MTAELLICVISTCLLFAGCSREQPKTDVRKASSASPRAPATPVSDDRAVIAAFGDSLSAGFGADPESAFAVLMKGGDVGNGDIIAEDGAK